MYCLLVMCCLATVHIACAQRVTVLPQAGDTVVSLVDNLPTRISIGQSGPNQVWDFTYLQSPFKRRYAFKEQDEPGRLRIHQSDVAFEYVQRGDDFYLTHIINADPLLIGKGMTLTCSPALLEYKNPIRYNTATSTYSRLIGYLPWAELPSNLELPTFNGQDSLRLVLEIYRDDVVDGYGSLLMKNDLFEVVRLHRSEEQVLTIWAKEADRWQDITDQMKGQLKDIVWNSVTHSYLFLADDKPTPIAEVYVGADDVVKKVIYSVDEQHAKEIETGRRLRGVYVYPNPTLGHVRFEFFNIPSGPYKLSVFNMLGQHKWSQEVDVENGSVIRADLTHLDRGSYFYSLTDADGKRLFTRRIIIFKP